MIFVMSECVRREGDNCLVSVQHLKYVLSVSNGICESR